MAARPDPTITEVFSIGDALRRRAETAPAELALLAPNRQPITWAGLVSQLKYVGDLFDSLGIGGNDRIAVALPDGPEMAAAFLTISSFAAFAPLNPAYLTDDFEFYLSDLRAKALILPAGQPSPARAVARKHKIPILELIRPADGPAGHFKLESENEPPPTHGMRTQDPGSDHVALVLHTSGTTSRPKMVPLTQRNLCSSARHIASTLSLGSSDRGLCIMPLFHIHGLIGCLLSSVVAGGSVICSPGFSAQGFLDWLNEFRPTWFSGVPTMHQSMLSRAAEHQRILAKTPLRFIRSSSSPLPPQVMDGLEKMFGVPVIESYGMTEASHQIASNQLPPCSRKPGSVGKPAGPEVAIMDQNGSLVTNGQDGEIVIRGPNVTRGYANNPTATSEAFTDGWFRTGDIGYFDSEGFLFITGRRKELINRGGEKIAPREIDEVLLSHDAVAQAVAFAMPHPTLGEDVAAAVVVKGGSVCSEAELRAFALQRLPAFKAPTRIVQVAEIPKGPTGKIQRIGLASRLAQALAINFEPPLSETEALISGAISTILGRPIVGRNDNFFAIGGDSLRAAQVIARLSQTLGIEIPVLLAFRFPTPALLAVELDRRVAELDVISLAAELEKLPAEEIARLLDNSAAAPSV